MREGDVELVVQRARELHPAEGPRSISDNGPQFIARDFKELSLPQKVDASTQVE
jgi:hypothetical protein